MENFDMENALDLIVRRGDAATRRNYKEAPNIAEAIVREHRKHWDTIHHDNFESQDHQGPIGELSKTRNHRGSTLELVIWALVIACLIYLSVFVFGPFLKKIFF